MPKSVYTVEHAIQRKIASTSHFSLPCMASISYLGESLRLLFVIINGCKPELKLNVRLYWHKHALFLHKKLDF
jgi:hypothetical protein